MLPYEKISKENRILAVLCIVLASIFFCVVLGLQVTIFETNTHRVFVSRIPLTTTTTPEPGKMSWCAARGYYPKKLLRQDNIVHRCGFFSVFGGGCQNYPLEC